jgi:phosphatidylserine/phosphatidylglycerophosphate/cardiolipin synthase-like enzyme
MVSPFVQRLVNKSAQGVDVKIILDYTPDFEDTTALLNETKQYLEEHGVEVKFIVSDSSPFTTVHNKGMIIDNTTVLISSINWNEVSVRRNREAGVLIQNKDVAAYYATVFFSDWYLDVRSGATTGFSWADYKNLMLIALVCGITAALIIRDWRKRKWR